MFFNPVLQIQLSDDTFDWKKIATIELLNISFEENYPSGIDRRIIQTTCSFVLPIFVAVPAKIRNNWIKDINMRVGLISGAIQGSSGDIIAEMDDLGFEYENIFSVDDFELPE